MYGIVIIGYVRNVMIHSVIYVLEMFIIVPAVLLVDWLIMVYVCNHVLIHTINQYR